MTSSKLWLKLAPGSATPAKLRLKASPKVMLSTVAGKVRLSKNGSKVKGDMNCHAAWQADAFQVLVEIVCQRQGLEVAWQCHVCQVLREFSAEGQMQQTAGQLLIETIAKGQCLQAAW